LSCWLDAEQAVPVPVPPTGIWKITAREVVLMVVSGCQSLIGWMTQGHQLTKGIPRLEVGLGPASIEHGSPKERIGREGPVITRSE